MKPYYLQIAHMLSAYHPDDVIAGIQAWLEGVEIGMHRQGWKPVIEKPINREYFELGGLYYIEDKSHIKSHHEMFVMPPCPQCGETLYLQYICTKDKTNKVGWQSLWLCTNDDCSYKEYSLKSLNEWYKELKKKEA